LSHPIEHDHEKARRWYLPMAARDPSEEHRAATPLELFFDLCFVVAIALAASNLHHQIVENHIADGVLTFLLVFFGIWWAWMNFTWFASAFDIDDGVYRLTTFVQMSGALVMAAGVPRIFESSDSSSWAVALAGYVVMRLAMVTQWLRAAQMDEATRPGALRYAIGIFVLQVLWVLRLLFLDGDVGLASFFVLAIGELLVPVFAEQAARTSWHPHHIAERYGLFTIIVLGESILAATLAFQSAFDDDLADVRLLALAVSALVIVFSLWWIYFDQAEHPSASFGAAFRWGYGHLVIFASAAAVGAAIALAVDQKTDHTAISDATAALALAIPVALYVLGVWFIHILPNRDGWMVAAFPICAVLVLVTAAGGLWAFPGVAILLAVLVGLMQYEEERLEALAKSPVDSASDL